MTGTNGAHPDPAALVGTFDYDKWRRLTDLALAEGRTRLARAEEAFAEARAALDARRAELDVLERALSLRPEPPPKEALWRGTRPGSGVGARAGVFLLECFTQRYAASGDATFTTRLAQLAAKGWPKKTVQDGLTRLFVDGMIERTGLGRYTLTELGRTQPPAPAGALPLLPPREPEEATTA